MMILLAQLDTNERVSLGGFEFSNVIGENAQKYANSLESTRRACRSIIYLRQRKKEHVGTRIIDLSCREYVN